MEVIFLDDNISLLKYCKVISLQWHRKYYEPGQFLIQILASDYESSMKYVKLSERDEIGIIQKIQYEQTVKGAFIQLSGFFGERILWEWVNYPTYYCKQTYTDLEEWMMTYLIPSSPRLWLKYSLPILEIMYRDEAIKCSIGPFQNTGDYEGETIYKILKEYECSISVTRDIDADDEYCYLEIWKGKDRTQDQSKYSYATFSTAFGNVKNIKLIIDESNYKNVAIVAGAGEGDARYNVTVDESGEKHKFHIFVNASQESPDNYNQTDPAFTNYLNGLRQIGRNNLRTDYSAITNIEFEAVQKNIIYRRDYDLGDVCDIIIDEMKKSFTARLIEVLETWEKGEQTITLTFGDKIPTKYEKARLR